MPTTKLTARTANKHQLYEQCVQSPDVDVPIIHSIFRRIRGRTPRILQEDFCGTACLAIAWVKYRRAHTAIGIDLDPDPLNYGKRVHVPTLGKRQHQLTLIQGNVLTPRCSNADIVIAPNFSYLIFKTRQELKRYLQTARNAMAKDGILILDLYGGPEAQTRVEEHKKYRGFTYIWDQDTYNPITAETRCYIHFKFPDGSMMKKAFQYDWRLWSLPEIRELLLESGFKEAKTFWEGTDKNGNGNGIFRERARVENETSWIAYIVGVK